MSTIQEKVTFVKNNYNNMSDNYLVSADGKSITFVKHWSKWKAADLITVDKEEKRLGEGFSITLPLLRDAAAHINTPGGKYVLTELLPDYYRDHGGIEAFAAAIKDPKAAAAREAKGEPAPTTARSTSGSTNTGGEYPKGAFGGNVFVLKNFYEDFIKRNHPAFAGLGITTDSDQWTKADFEKLAKHKNSFQYFQMLLDIATVLRDPNAPEWLKEDARTAMRTLAPENYGKAGDSAYNAYRIDIISVADKVYAQSAQTTPERLQYKGSLYDLDASYDKPPTPGVRRPDPVLKKSYESLRLKSGDNRQGFHVEMDGITPDVGLNKVEDKAFDQQAALELLAQHSVAMDAEHSLKSPDPKAAALEAVKALKINIRRA